MVLATAILSFLILVPSVPFSRTLPPGSVPPWCNNSYPPSLSCPIVAEKTVYHGFGSVAFDLAGFGYSFWSGGESAVVAQNSSRIVGFLRLNDSYELDLYDGKVSVANFVVTPVYKVERSGQISVNVAVSAQRTENLSLVAYSMTIEGMKARVSSYVSTWGEDSPLVSLSKSNSTDGRGQTFTVNNWYEIGSGFAGFDFSTVLGQESEGIVFKLHLDVEQSGHHSGADRVLEVSLASLS